jgi:hypothetical protein
MAIKSIFKRNLRQDAVHWPTSTVNRTGGLVPGTAEQIKVRWERKQQLFIDEQGQESTSVAEVYTAKELTTEAWLMLGTLDDLESNEKPSSGFTRYKILAVEAMPSKSNRATLYKCWLGLVRT